MARPIITSLSPNTQSDDIKRAWRVLLRPRTWNDSRHLQSVEDSLSAYLNQTPVVLTSSGRSAFAALLNALDIGSGNEVIIQAFTCIAVPAAVKWVKATPVYADIDPATYNLNPGDVEKKITPHTKAIVVQHTFGMPGPVEELRRIASHHNLVLIEDCAHGLGASYREQPVGTLGDAAFFSFGRDKILSSVFGGAVASRDPDILRRVRQYQQSLANPPRSWVLRQLLHPILLSAIIPFYFTASLGKISLVLLQKLRILSKAVEAGEKQGGKPIHLSFRFSPALAQLLQLQLAKLSNYTQRRRNIVRRYQTALVNTKFSLPSPPLDANPSWVRYPLQVDQRAHLQQRAKENNIVLGDWYNSPLAPSDCNLEAFGYHPGACPEAEAVSKRVINLPTYPLLTDSQIEHIIAVVKQYAK